jgi:hypothetical protein
MPPGDIPFIPGDFEYGTMGLAKAAPVALGDFIVNGL